MNEVLLIIREIVLLFTLTAEAVLDARKGVVSIWWMLPAGLCGLICNSGDMRWVWNVLMTLCCLAAGCGLSKMTEGAFGLGDVWVLGCLCLNEGGAVMLEVFMTALLSAALYGGGLMLCKKVKKDYGIRFVPFLCAAYVIVLSVRAASRLRP